MNECKYFNRFTVVCKKDIVTISEEDCLDVNNGKITGDFLKSYAEREMLVDFVECFFEPIRNFNYKHSSYGLKHIAENFLGFYVSNSDMKAAMVKCGFKVDDIHSLNWYFNLSEKSVNRLIAHGSDIQFGECINNYFDNLKEENK